MKDKKKLAVDVYLENRKSRSYVGRLEKVKSHFIFKYHLAYQLSERAMSLGPDLPLIKSIHKSSSLFPTFEDRIPPKKNPAYKDYCRRMGISPEEKDPLILLATIGQRGPSSFIFSSANMDQFSKEEMIEFRKKLKLSIREFADLFDFSPATIQRIEKGKTSGKDALKRIELYYKFPNVALFELERSGAKINGDAQIHVEYILRSAIKTSS